MRGANLLSRNMPGLRAWIVIGLFCYAAVACNSWFDQSEVTRDRADRLVVPILDSIDPIDEPDTEFAGAQDVRPSDLVYFPTDYIIGAKDVLSVSVFDLAGPAGVETTKLARVSDTGMISLPMLPDPVKAAGLTEFELQRKIVEQYDIAKVLTNARVSVSVAEPRQQQFSISGGVGRPGAYPIADADYRLLNAMIAAGDVTGPTDFVYVVRRVKSETPTTRPGVAPANVPPAPVPLAPTSTQPGRDILAPGGGEEAMSSFPMLAMADAADANRPATVPVTPLPPAGGGERLFNLEGQTRVLGATQPQPAAPGEVAPPTTQPATPEVVQPPYEFGAAPSEDDTRVIRVPLRLLKNGDLRYNIVIRPFDVILVPLPMPAFYYVGGHVAAPGAYNMTGQRLTLKDAIIAARMLDPLAVPSRTDVIRRIGNNELFVRVNLWDVFAGKQPDLYLKPNDKIIVGTDWYPPFLQAVRGAFRLTYGFGFLYDRNYAPAQTGTAGSVGSVNVTR